MKKFLLKTTLLLVLPLAGFLNAEAQLPLVEGDLVVTFKNGQVSFPTATNAVLAILKTSNTSGAVPGQVWTLPSSVYGGTKPAWYSDPSWTAANLGNIFGITIDNYGNIMVSSSQIYGGGISNQISQIDGITGGITNITPAVGAGDYGNIKFTKIGNDGYLFFSDWGNGLIHCLKRIGNTNNANWVSQPSYNPEFGRIGGGPDNNNLSVKQIPYGLAIRKTASGGKLYYSRIGESSGHNGNCTVNSTASAFENEIWSVDLNASGGFIANTETAQNGEYLFGSTGTYYFNQPFNSYAHKNPIADIAFSNDGKRMLIAQQSLGELTCLNSHRSEVGEFIEVSTGNWMASGKTFPTGNGSTSSPATSQSNAVGGISYSNNVLYRDGLALGCDTTVWAVSDAIQYQSTGVLPVTPINPLLTGDNVYGLIGYTNQGIAPYAGTSATANFGNALLIDEDDNYATHDKYFLGDVEAFKKDSACNPLPCNCGQILIEPSLGGIGINDTVIIAGPIGGVINYAYQCSGGGCGATYNWQITSSSNTTVASGNTFPFDLALQSIPPNCGIYNLVIKAYCGSKICDSIVKPIKITLKLALTQADVICQTLGTATATVTGGVIPYTYLWTPGNLTTQTINAGTGAYSLTVTDLNGCTTTGSVVIGTTFSTVAFNIASTPFTCTTGGTATINITSGTSPFTYLWSNGATTQTTSGLPVGTYSVTVTDSNGCVNTGSVTISNECNSCTGGCLFSGSLSRPERTNFNCGDTLQMLCNTQYVGGVNYTCASSVPISLGITLVTGPDITVPSVNYYFTVPGLYSFTYYAYQNGHLCDSCTVYVKVTCRVFCCKGSGWGTIKSSVNNVVISAKPTAAHNISANKPKIYCRDTVNIKCTDKFYLASTFICPAPCVGSVIYTLTTPNNTVFYTGAGPINNVVLSTAGLYTLTLDGYCTDPNGNKTRCSTCTIFIKVTGTILLPLPEIKGITTACENGTKVNLSIADTDGKWSSSNEAVATINVNGWVTPRSAGITTITYTKKCYSSHAATLFTVYEVPVLPVLKGESSLCTGATSQLNVDSPGGVWSSGHLSIFTVNQTGLVYGVSEGSARVYYTVTNSSGCSSTAQQLITVHGSPSVPDFSIATPPADFNAVCAGYTTLLINETPTGGVFASSNTNVATIDNNNILTAVEQGSVAISYSVSNLYGCTNAKSFNLGVISCPQPKSVNLVKSNDQAATAADWIMIYPNPAKGNSVVQASVSNRSKNFHGTIISIHDIYGKKLLIKKVTIGDNSKVTIGNWAKGIYLVNLIYGTQNKTGRLVIE